MSLYKNKYRIESNRLKGYDYSSNGFYFVTICVKDRVHCFGEIYENEVQLSALGESAKKCWLEIPKHFPFVILDEFIIMPDHVHGIIEINKQQNDINEIVDSVDGIDHINGVDRIDCINDIDGIVVETQNFASLPSMVPVPLTLPKPLALSKSLTISPSIQKSVTQYGPQSKNLPSIIRGYKIGVTKYARNNNILFQWQPRYHDHIIRDTDELNRIRKYIKNNPAKWQFNYNVESNDRWTVKSEDWIVRENNTKKWQWTAALNADNIVDVRNADLHSVIENNSLEKEMEKLI